MYVAFLVVTLLFAITLRRYTRPFDSERRCAPTPPPPCAGRQESRLPGR